MDSYGPIMPREPGTASTVLLQRPATSPVRSRLTARQAAGRAPEVRPGSGSSDGQSIELLEYEWPDLPPLPSFKDAVTRSRVSHGISYLLPVDKGLNSITSKYRTDLRAMFQEPYASEQMQFDESRIRLSSAVHFRSNTGDTRWTRQHLSSLPVHLNADCENTRRLYARSAPSGGRTCARMGLDPHKLRTRSSLYLPMKVQVPPEFLKLRQEVQDIIKSVREDDGDFEEGNFVEEQVVVQDAELEDNGQWNTDTADIGRADGMGKKESLLGSPRSHAKRRSVIKPSDRYNTYDELKRAKVPKPQIPDRLKSQYLNEQQNQRIWDWLHQGQQMTDFEYFLSVCG